MLPCIPSKPSRQKSDKKLQKTYRLRSNDMNIKLVSRDRQIVYNWDVPFTVCRDLHVDN